MSLTAEQEQALDFTTSNLELEGLQVTSADKQQFRDYVAGKTSRDDFIAQTQREIAMLNKNIA